MSKDPSQTNTFIERRQRSRNRTWLTLRMIIMAIVLAGSAWAGFWVWLGQDSDVAVFLGEWVQLAVILVALVFGAAVLLVMARKIYKLIRPDNDSLAHILASGDDKENDRPAD